MGNEVSISASSVEGIVTINSGNKSPEQLTPLAMVFQKSALLFLLTSMHVSGCSYFESSVILHTWLSQVIHFPVQGCPENRSHPFREAEVEYSFTLSTVNECGSA